MRPSAMTISSTLFEAFLKCPTKCWLRANGEPASDNAYTESVEAQDGAYRARETERLLSETPKNGDATFLHVPASTAPQKDAGQTGEVSPFTQGACDSGEENPHRREPGIED